MNALLDVCTIVMGIVQGSYQPILGLSDVNLLPALSVLLFAGLMALACLFLVLLIAALELIRVRQPVVIPLEEEEERKHVD